MKNMKKYLLMIPVLASFGYMNISAMYSSANDVDPQGQMRRAFDRRYFYDPRQQGQEEGDGAFCEHSAQCKGEGATPISRPTPSRGNSYGKDSGVKAGTKESSALLDAIAYGDYDRAAELIHGNVNINVRDADGYTPLMLAVMYSNYPLLANESLNELIDTLIAHNADPTLQRPQHDWLYNIAQDESIKELLKDYTFEFMSPYRDQNGIYKAPKYNNYGNVIKHS